MNPIIEGILDHHYDELQIYFVIEMNNDYVPITHIVTSKYMRALKVFINVLKNVIMYHVLPYRHIIYSVDIYDVKDRVYSIKELDGFWSMKKVSLTIYQELN